MKKNNIIIVLLIITSLILMSCNPSNKTDSEETTVATDSYDKEESNEESENPNIETMPEENKKETKEAEKEETTSEGDVNISLFDKALLASYKIKTPDTMTAHYSEVSRFSFSETEEEPEDTLTTSIQYIDGKNNRMENIDEFGTTVSLYIADEKTTYEYTEGETIGSKYEEDTLMDNMYFHEYEGKTLLELFEDIIKASVTDLEMDMELKANRDKLAGRKAIRIEFVIPEEVLQTMEESGEDLGMEIDGPFTIFTYWIDQEYTAILGMEMKFGDTWYMYQEATEIEFNKKVDKDLFVPPSDIIFELQEW